MKSVQVFAPKLGVMARCRSWIVRAFVCSWRGHDDMGTLGSLRCSTCGRRTGLVIDGVGPSLTQSGDRERHRLVVDRNGRPIDLHAHGEPIALKPITDEERATVAQAIEEAHRRAARIMREEARKAYALGVLELIDGHEGEDYRGNKHLH